LLLAFSSSSPQPPTLADYGITKDTLHRLALLKVKVEPHSSCSSDNQWSVIEFLKMFIISAVTNVTHNLAVLNG